MKQEESFEIDRKMKTSASSSSDGHEVSGDKRQSIREEASVKKDQRGGA